MISQILSENDYNLMLGLTVILLTGLAFGKLSKLLKIPNVTGYLLGGFIIGPGFLRLFFPDFNGVIGEDFIHSLKIIADIELAFIAFSIGAEFKLEYLKRLGPAPVIIAFLESFFAVVFITLGLLMFGFPLYIALAFGAVGGATAPAATLPNFSILPPKPSTSLEPVSRFFLRSATSRMDFAPALTTITGIFASE